jgi:predicted DNA-binding WGR domain protein
MATRHNPMVDTVENPVTEIRVVEWRHSRWERETRYYELWVQQDLFGHWLLTKIWGRQGSALGQLRHEVCADQAEANARYAEAAVRRAKRGYLPIKANRSTAGLQAAGRL